MVVMLSVAEIQEWVATCNPKSKLAYRCPRGVAVSVDADGTIAPLPPFANTPELSVCAHWCIHRHIWWYWTNGDVRDECADMGFEPEDRLLRGALIDGGPLTDALRDILRDEAKALGIPNTGDDDQDGCDFP